MGAGSQKNKRSRGIDNLGNDSAPFHPLSRLADDSQINQIKQAKVPIHENIFVADVSQPKSQVDGFAFPDRLAQRLRFEQQGGFRPRLTGPRAAGVNAGKQQGQPNQRCG